MKKVQVIKRSVSKKDAANVLAADRFAYARMQQRKINSKAIKFSRI